MQAEAVKDLVDKCSVNQLADAEMALLNEEPMAIAVAGADDAEQLAHISAAVWVIEQMESHDWTFDQALEVYTTTQ